MSDDLERRVTKVEYQQDGLQSTMTKMDGKLDLIVSQVSKITILELNHQQHKETFARAFKRIEELETQNQGILSSLNTAKGGAGMLKYLIGAFGMSLIGLIVFAIQSLTK